MPPPGSGSLLLRMTRSLRRVAIPAAALAICATALPSMAQTLDARHTTSRASSVGPEAAGREQGTSPLGSVSRGNWAPGNWPAWGRSVTTNPPSARDLLHGADDDLIAGRERDAANKLEVIVEHYPGSPEANIAQERLARSLPSGSGPAPRVGQRNPARDTDPSETPIRPPIATDAAMRRGGEDFKLTIGDRIFFDAASARIEPRQRSVLVAQATWLKAHPGATLNLQGHADDPGGRDLNTQLATERVEAARLVLLKEGIGIERIEIEAIGDAKPVALCANVDAALRAACMAQNRRVVSVIEWPDTQPRRRLGARQSAHTEGPHAQILPSGSRHGQSMKAASP